MPDTPLRFDHLAIPVYDAAATHRFYTEVLQLPLVDALSGDDWGGKPWLMMLFGTGSGQLLALCALHGAQRPPPDGLPADMRHYAFSVASLAEQADWKVRLRRHHIAFSEEDHGTQHSIYFSDPNGIVLEVTTPPSPPESQPAAHAAERVQRWIAAQSDAAAPG
jgi:catechol 2,3-dioxygenase-like lactoylglutathione lyase family enzyme